MPARAACASRARRWRCSVGTRRLRFIDLCAGAGGWACAARGLPIDIVLAVDVDAWALKTYRFNHPDTWCVQADVLEFDFSPLKDQVDGILAGIPCELISKARGVPATQDQLAGLDRLIDRLLALPGELGARWWCYEDVPPIVKRLPILTPWQRIDSRHYSAQGRKRVYVGRFPAPARGKDERVIDDVLRPGPFLVNRKLWNAEPRSHGTYQAGYFLPAHRGKKSKTVTMTMEGAGKRGLGVEEDGFWRALSWREAALLQGFPEDYVFVGSMTHACKTIGQAVQVDTGRAILEAICREAAA